MQAKLYFTNILIETTNKKTRLEFTQTGFYSTNKKSGTEIYFQHQRNH